MGLWARLKRWQFRLVLILLMNGLYTSSMKRWRLPDYLAAFSLIIFAIYGSPRYLQRTSTYLLCSRYKVRRTECEKHMDVSHVIWCVFQVSSSQDISLMIYVADHFVKIWRKSGTFHVLKLYNTPTAILTDLCRLYHEYGKELEPILMLFVKVKLEGEPGSSRSEKALTLNTMRFQTSDRQELGGSEWFEALKDW